MYKVMLVDDDYPVLEFLSFSIPWQELNLQLTGMFENGMDALGEAEREMPDILITDIGMPQMNGLVLIEKLLVRNPKLRTVIVSCLDDFEMARQAVRLGVNDYVLKESMQPQYMKEMLKKLCDQLDQERNARNQSEHWKHMVLENRSNVGETFLYDTVNRPILNEQEWYFKAEAAGITLHASEYTPVLCYVNRYLDTKKRFVSDQVLSYAMLNMIEEILRPIHGATVTRWNAKLYFLWFPISKSLKYNQFDEIEKALAAIQGALQQYLKVRTSFLFGYSCRWLSEVKASLLQLLKSVDVRFYLEEGRIYRQTSIDFSSEDVFVHYSEASRQFLHSLLEQNTEKAGETVAYWMEIMKQHHFPPQLVKDWVLKILYDMQFKLRAMQHFQTRYSIEVLHQTVAEIDTIDHLEAWVSRFMEEMIPHVSTIYLESKRPEMMLAKRYVEQHLDCKITLDDMAGELHLNPSYFSRLFKKETGENFIEYVTRMKVGRAKQLLQIAGKSIDEVADALGYDNKSYFIKIFKGLTGVTPGEYRGKGAGRDEQSLDY